MLIIDGRIDRRDGKRRSSIESASAVDTWHFEKGAPRSVFCDRFKGTMRYQQWGPDVVQNEEHGSHGRREHVHVVEK